MCGIVGITSKEDSIAEILSGLKALEYRGYDSSGIACSNDKKRFWIWNSNKKISLF